MFFSLFSLIQILIFNEPFFFSFVRKGKPTKLAEFTKLWLCAQIAILLYKPQAFLLESVFNDTRPLSTHTVILNGSSRLVYRPKKRPRKDLTDTSDKEKKTDPQLEINNISNMELSKKNSPGGSSSKKMNSKNHIEKKNQLTMWQIANPKVC